jgi:hypothetical protein
MAKNKISISLEDTMRSVGKSIQKVVAAKFAGSPGTASSIKGKSKTAQLTFKVTGANEKRSALSQARRAALARVFTSRASDVERIIKKALESVIAGLVGAGDSNVKVFGRSLGRAKPTEDIDNAPFARFIKSKPGAGEIGLPDPSESLNNLKAALLASISVDVVVREKGPQIKFRFDQRKLLKLTPHPSKFESGAAAPFFSWLSLVTGPSFVKSGTPGFGFVTAADLLTELHESSRSFNGRSSKISLRRANIVDGMMRASRTSGNAGSFAGLMLSTRSKGKGKSPAEAFGGVTQDYRPSARFDGYWDRWWMNLKIDLSVWGRRVVRATVRELLKS